MAQINDATPVNRVGFIYEILTCFGIATMSKRAIVSSDIRQMIRNVSPEIAR